MTVTVSWSITTIGLNCCPRHCTAADHTAAWTAALRAARHALLIGKLDNLAVTLGDNYCDALCTPARDHHGCIDPDQLTTALIDLHHAATAGNLADQLTATPAGNSHVQRTRA